MDDISILHLSDLHIDSSGNPYSTVLSNLIKSIRNQYASCDEQRIVVVVTGDIIHKGEKKAVDKAFKFFEKLYETIGDRVAAIYIVPGNHDKKRSEENKFLNLSYRFLRQRVKVQIEKERTDNQFEEGLFGESFFKDNQKKILAPYIESGYMNLVRQVYELFGMDKKKKYVSDTFGVDVVEVMGKKYCFVLFNTSWNCTDDYDNRQIIVGNFQLNRILTEYKNLCPIDDKKDLALTIAMGHHPFASLYGYEQDIVSEALMPWDGLGVNMYLCGHIHNRKIMNMINNWHSINTFVTGIGWPDGLSEEHKYEHYYSVYNINLDLNSVDVLVKCTNNELEFMPDNRIYSVDSNSKLDKVVFPIKSHKALTYAILKTPKEENEVGLYFSDEKLKKAEQYVIRFGEFQKRIGKQIENSKESFVNIVDSELYGDIDDEEFDFVIDDENDLENAAMKILEDETLTEDEAAEIRKFCKKHRDQVYMNFWTYIQAIADIFNETLINKKDDAAEECVVRFHFRYLDDRRSIRYKKLAESFSMPKLSELRSVSDSEYTDLLEAADKAGTGLIYNINRKHSEKILDKSKWYDYYSIVPSFERNRFYKNKSKSDVSYPNITCGVTISTAKYDWLLYCMDIFQFDKSIESALSYYVNLLHIDLEDFCNWWKNADKKVAEK